MKSLLATLAFAFSFFLTPALAADGASDATDGEKQPTMKQLEDRIKDLAASLVTLTGNVGTLTTKVDNFAGRGHQVAIVMTVPIALADGNRVQAVRVDYHLVGNSTIPGFPSGTVAANGKFARYTAPLPVGTYLFELQQPYSDRVVCNGSVSRVHSVPVVGGGAGTVDCPRIVLFGSQGTSGSSSTRFNDGFAVYKVTSSTGHFSVRHKFPNNFAFTDQRPLGSYRGSVKITKLK